VVEVGTDLTQAGLELSRALGVVTHG